jgi:peptidoglycan/xylan/chitin deacetylase (PgdA/CDA1 family)
MLHHFHGAGHVKSPGSLSAREFRTMIRHLGPDRILPPEEWTARAEDGELDLDHLCLTFDDNLRCQFDVALPVLREFGLTAFWFIPTATLSGAPDRLEVYRAFRSRCFPGVEAFYDAFERMIERFGWAIQVATALRRHDVETYLWEFSFYTPTDRRFRFVRDEVLGPARYGQVMDALMADRGVDPGDLARGLWMDRDCIRELHDDGHVIGLHSHTHPTRLARLSLDAQHREYHRNYMALRRITGRPPLAVSHPCNSYGEVTLAILREMGVRIGFRANMGLEEFSELEYPREDHANILTAMQTCESRSLQATSPAILR